MTSLLDHGVVLVPGSVLHAKIFDEAFFSVHALSGQIGRLLILLLDFLQRVLQVRLPLLELLQKVCVGTFFSDQTLLKNSLFGNDKEFSNERLLNTLTTETSLV